MLKNFLSTSPQPINIFSLIFIFVFTTIFGFAPYAFLNYPLRETATQKVKDTISTVKQMGNNLNEIQHRTLHWVYLSTH